MATLAEIRAKLQAATQKENSTSSGDGATFAHWNIPEGSTTTIRFLPDGNPSNTFFWKQREMLRFPFQGVKGDTNSKEVYVQVPCMEMYGEACPVLAEVRPWWNDKSLEDQAKTYWKKYAYIFQGFVVNTDLKEENAPENPIRRFVINKQIFNLVKNALMDSEIEELPTDYLRGLDFKVTKTSKGKFADYTTSTWARRERALSEEELAAIDQFGLTDLSTFLPKKPDDEHLRVIMEMFEASVDGEAYDPERWGQFYRPQGLILPNGTSAPKQSTYQPKREVPVETYSAPREVEVEQVEVTPVAETRSTESSSQMTSNAQYILARIKARKAQQS